jgi:hypothetical protein
MLRLTAFAIVLAISCAGTLSAAEPVQTPAPIPSPEQWAKNQHASIVLEACTEVWAATAEDELDRLVTLFALQQATTEKAIGTRSEALRTQTNVAEAEYKRFQGGSDAEKIAVSKRIFEKLNWEWESLLYMGQKMPEVKYSIDKCVKDQRAYLRGEADKPKTLFEPISVDKDVQGIWKVTCNDPADGKSKIYAGAFGFTIAAGDLGGNKLKGTIKGTPAGDLELNGFLHTEESSFSVTTPNPDGSAKNAFILSGKVTNREDESPEASGTILASVNGVLGCPGEFSRHGTTSPGGG